MKPATNASQALVLLASWTGGAPPKRNISVLLKSQRTFRSSCAARMICTGLAKALIWSSISFIARARRLGSGGGIVDGSCQEVYLCISWNLELRRLQLLVFVLQGWASFRLPFEKVGMTKVQGWFTGLTVLRFDGSIS